MFLGMVLRVNELLYSLNMSNASKRNFVLGDWSSTQNQIEDLIKKINAYYLKSLNENERREFSEIEQYIKAYAQAFREIVEKNQKESDSRLVFADIDFAHQQLNEAILLVQQTIENKIAQSKTNLKNL